MDRRRSLLITSDAQKGTALKVGSAGWLLVGLVVMLLAACGEDIPPTFGPNPTQQIRTSLEQGQIAATLLPEARVVQAEEDGLATVLGEHYLPDGMRYAYIYTTRVYVAAEPANVSVFLAGM